MTLLTLVQTLDMEGGNGGAVNAELLSFDDGLHVGELWTGGQVTRPH